MKLKEFLKVFKGTIDVYENVADLIGVALVWDCQIDKLTPDGEKRFEAALNYEILWTDGQTLILDTEKTVGTDKVNSYDFDAYDDVGSEENIPEATLNAIDFFMSAAGYCKSSDYDKWFESGNENYSEVNDLKLEGERK